MSFLIWEQLTLSKGERNVIKNDKMTFKEELQRDLDSVFLNLEEFAEFHRVEGKKIPVVVDNDQLNKLKEGQIIGLIEADMLLMGKEKNFPDNLEPGRLLNVDGREMLIINSGGDMGLVEVALRQNRTSGFGNSIVNKSEGIGF